MMDNSSNQRETGRPKTHIEASRKTTVLLYLKQIAFLDRLSTDILEATGTTLDRGAVIRSLISALQESGLSLSKIKTEEDMKNMILRLLVASKK